MLVYQPNTRTLSLEEVTNWIEAEFGLSQCWFINQILEPFLWKKLQTGLKRNLV